MSASSGFNLTVTDGIARLVFDLPNEKVNKLTTAVMTAFSQQLDQFKTNTQIRVLVISSAKPGCFIAGADIAEIQHITDPKDGLEKSKMGQNILNQLAGLPFPTVAAIDGVCLGGGLELALACQFRLVSDHPKTILGLPEVNLGILPGFGGTQRLPRLIGLQAALPLILSGKTVDGKKAEKLKIADACFDTAFFEEKVTQFLTQIVDPSKRKKRLTNRNKKNLGRYLMEHNPIGRTVLYMMAKKSTLQQTKGQYPAPIKALQATVCGFSKSLASGLRLEAKLFSQLVSTDISKNLIYLFYINEEQKKYTGISDDSIQPVSINRSAVLGAGLMGGGIAWLLSSKYIDVRLKDLNWQAITKAYEAAQKIIFNGVKKKKVKPHEANLTMHRLSGTTDYSGFGSVQLVIEAVVENMDIKKKVFTELEQVVSEKTIIASNTSALSITEMASGLKHPERFVGMHFFSPVHKMPLVEIIAGDKTSPQTITSIVALTKQLGKVPVVVKNMPGFLVNRILIPYVNEAVMLLEEGAKIDQIDRIMTEFGMPIGPLALADEVGLDVGYKVAKELEEGFGERMKVADSFSKIMDVNHLRGKKTGKGFYIHGSKNKGPNPEIDTLIVKRTGPALSNQEILERLVFSMINEAAKCLNDGVVQNPKLLDIAMIMGTGFPPFRGGLCRYAQEIGIEYVFDRLSYFAEKYDKRFTPDTALKKMNAVTKQGGK